MHELLLISSAWSNIRGALAEPGWWSFGLALLVAVFTGWARWKTRQEAEDAALKQKNFEEQQARRYEEFRERQDRIERRFRTAQVRVARLEQESDQFSIHLAKFNRVPPVSAAGDPTRDAQDAARFFRDSVRHYGECRRIFEGVKSDLTVEDRRRLDVVDREVTRYLTKEFDVSEMKGLVQRQGEFLGIASRVMERRLEELKAELDDS